MTYLGKQIQKRKASKGIEKDRKASKGIERDRKASKGISKRRRNCNFAASFRTWSGRIWYNKQKLKKNGKTNNTFCKQQKSRTDIDINPTFEYFQNKNPFRTS